MLTDEITGFLAEVMPFNFLSRPELESIVEDIALEYYPRGSRILTQDGPPSDFLFVIKKGGVKIFMAAASGEETVIDFRGEGEQFGLLSIVGGDRSRTNVSSVEDTICYLIAREKILTIIRENPAANEYLLKSFFVNFIDKTYEQTRKKIAGSGSSEQLLYTTPVGRLVRSKPITAGQNLSIMEAAQKMAREKISSLIVVDESDVPVGMLTDRDLREKVVAEGLDVKKPVSLIMSGSLISIDANEYCFEALLKMIQYKIHHILVMENNRLKGMVTNHDFMSLQGSSPTALIKDISKIQSLDELAESAANIYKTVAALLGNGARIHNITGLISEISEKVSNRAADFIEEQAGDPPMPYTIFVFGDGGRRELLLDFHLQLGIVYPDDGSPSLPPEMKKYFSAFAAELNRVLEKSFGPARQYLELENIKSFSEWKDFFRAAVAESNTGPRARFFEMRAIRGSDKTVAELKSILLRVAATSDDFMELMAVSTIQNRPPLGFFNKFVVEKTGEHKNQLNLYQKGVKPLVDIVRIRALEGGLEQRSTMDRLRDLKNFQFDQAKHVEYAVAYMMGFLLHKQLVQLEMGQAADNFVDPESLDNFEKKTLKEFFSLIADLYELTEKKYSTGWK